MKTIRYTYKPMQLLVLLGMLIIGACSDDLPEALDTSDKYTVLESIRLINAGENGDMIVEGTVNEMTKEISFPRIDPETDFSQLRFEITASDGARLEKESYEVVFGEGESDKSIVLKLVNDPRFREYYARFRLNIPVFGAEFGLATVYDYSANPGGNPVHDAFTGLLTRGSGFDGEYVLVASRASFSAANPHLLSVSDLKNNVVNRIPLNPAGIGEGTLVASGGAQINGHSYVANLSGGAASPLKVYHWTDPTQPAELIANVNIGSLSGAGVRHGDNVSFNIDNNGNGFIFFISQQGPILRLSVSNYTQVTNPTVLAAATTYGQWASMVRIGTTDSYLLTGNEHPISIASVGGAVSYTMASTSIPKQGVDPRVVEFNGERYLIMVTAARYTGESTTLYVYNITPGGSISEALANFEQTNRAPLYEYTLSSVPNSAPASQTGFHIVKDEEGQDSVLQLYAAGADAGFVVIEVPKKVLED